MQRRVIVMFAGALLAAGAAAPSVQQWDFERDTTGSLPRGWSADKTGEGPGSVWKIVEDATSGHGPKVLAQTSSEGPNPLFNVCVIGETSATDVDLSVAYKAVTGDLDQGGGPVWRYRDANNYYVARMNPLEGNYRVYKVVDGKRVQLATANVEVADDRWHTLRIVHRGNRIACHLNGRPYLQATDDALPGGGKIGLWTKADAVTYFDGLKISSGK